MTELFYKSLVKHSLQGERFQCITEFNSSNDFRLMNGWQDSLPWRQEQVSFADDVHAVHPLILPCLGPTASNCLNSALLLGWT
jgi:hypothetical protein